MSETEHRAPQPEQEWLRRHRQLLHRPYAGTFYAVADLINGVSEALLDSLVAAANRGSASARMLEYQAASEACVPAVTREQIAVALTIARHQRKWGLKAKINATTPLTGGELADADAVLALLQSRSVAPATKAEPSDEEIAKAVFEIANGWPWDKCDDDIWWAHKRHFLRSIPRLRALFQGVAPVPSVVTDAMVETAVEAYNTAINTAINRAGVGSRRDAIRAALGAALAAQAKSKDVAVKVGPALDAEQPTPTAAPPVAATSGPHECEYSRSKCDVSGAFICLHDDDPRCPDHEAKSAAINDAPAGVVAPIDSTTATGASTPAEPDDHPDDCMECRMIRTAPETGWLHEYAPPDVPIPCATCGRPMPIGHVCEKPEKTRLLHKPDLVPGFSPSVPFAVCLDVFCKICYPPEKPAEVPHECCYGEEILADYHGPGGCNTYACLHRADPRCPDHDAIISGEHKHDHTKRFEQPASSALTARERAIISVLREEIILATAYGKPTTSTAHLCKLIERTIAAEEQS